LTTHQIGAIIKVQKGKERRTYPVLYKYIVNGCECWLSKKTINRLERERKAIEDERRAYEQMHRAYEVACRTNDPIDWSIYSDLYKDCFGVRPH
jgi:hypothetical protein